jgi:hypothetical protein
MRKMSIILSEEMHLLVSSLQFLMRRGRISALISMHEDELERSEVRRRISFIFCCSDKNA